MQGGGAVILKPRGSSRILSGEMGRGAAEIRPWPCQHPRDALKQVATVPVWSESNHSYKRAAVAVLLMPGGFQGNHCEEIEVPGAEPGLL
jgi:hypothetical protein